jgi:glutamyl-tRNA synthetase
MVEDGVPPPEAKEAARKAALMNAAAHGGKSDVGAVVGRVLAEHPGLRGSPSLVAAAAREAVAAVNSLSQQELDAALKEYGAGGEAKKKPGRVGLPPLKNAVKGKTAFRLPPEPSGFMTVGHAMAFTINSVYSDEYDGVLWLRFEDTNPRKVAPLYYESFRRGIAWMGIEVDHEKNVSDDLETIYSYGKRLVEQGSAYTCSCDAEKVKKLRFEGKECEHRGNPTQENLSVWDGLVSRRYKEGEYVVRFKGDMKSDNFELRDTNLFRVIDHPHPLTGTSFSLWPTYDIANVVEDELCGVTHILRSSEFRTDLQQRLRGALGLRSPEVVQFSRFNFRGSPVAKRLLRPLVEQKLVSGWDDPRMPTVDGLVRRGVVPEAVKEFTLLVGYTKSEHEYDWSILLSINRKVLDPSSRRVFFVPEPAPLKVEGAPKRKVVLPYHPTSDLGTREIETNGEFLVPRADIEGLQEGESFRLMDLYNVKLESTRDGFAGSYAGDGLAPGVKKMQWTTPGSPAVRVLVPGPLFDDAGEFDPQSLKEVEGNAEESFASFPPGEIVQFPRFGFCRVDSPGTCILAG